MYCFILFRFVSPPLSHLLPPFLLPSVTTTSPPTPPPPPPPLNPYLRLPYKYVKITVRVPPTPLKCASTFFNNPRILQITPPPKKIQLRGVSSIFGRREGVWVGDYVGALIPHPNDNARIYFSENCGSKIPETKKLRGPHLKRGSIMGGVWVGGYVGASILPPPPFLLPSVTTVSSIRVK